VKTLFVSSQAPFRDTRFGGAKRLYYLAKSLEKQSDLRLLCLDGCREDGAGDKVRADFENALFLPNAPSVPLWDRFGFLPEVKRTVAAHEPLIRSFLGRDEVDLIVLAYPSVLRLLVGGLLPPSRKVIYIEDDLLLEQWRLSAREATRWRDKARFRLRHAQGAWYYRKAARRLTDVACITPQERDIARRLLPGPRTWILDYGMPLEEFPPLPAPKAHPVLGFIGNYDHIPNRDAALWLLSDLFPAVQKAEPEARLLLCGVGMTPEIRGAAHGNPAVTLLENIPRLRDFYEGISVFVNPIREGRGLRTKVLEAAAFGRPIVSTALGAEGLEDLDIPRFETPGELLEVMGGFGTEERRMAATEVNRRIVERRYALETVAKGLLAQRGT